MCGIAGIAVPSGRQVPVHALEQMAASLAHRGPDDLQLEVAGSVGLATTRLSIVDPTVAGRQPMVDPQGRWVIAYNGEVFNHAELRSQLPRHPYRGGSDTETVLRAIAEWGPSAVDRFNGLFAFAALDTAERRLLLVRDRFGVKPLYVARHDGALFFASEMRALLAAGIPARPRREVIAHTATRGWASGRPTPLQGIERVPPGTLVSVDLESLDATEHRWYAPSEVVDPELSRELATLDRAQLCARLDQVLSDAVRRRLMADVPVGTMCSGGLDSSLVTAIASGDGRSIPVFTASLEGPSWLDERPWAERAASALDVELHTVEVSVERWRAHLVRAVSYHEYPLDSGGSVPIFLIADEARRRGVKTLLTGEGADELFGGYLRGFQRPVDHSTRSRVRRRLRGVRRRWRTALNHARRRAAGRGAVAFSPSREIASFERAVTEQARRAYSFHPGPRGRIEARLLRDLSVWPLPRLLNRMDKDAMAASVETRIPFLDPHVVELSVNLPLQARVRPQVKGILRDVGRRYLPEEIALRTKQPGMLFNADSRIEEAARPEFLAQGMLRDVLRLPANGPKATALRPPRGRAVRLWTAEIWCRLVLDSQSVASVEADLWR